MSKQSVFRKIYDEARRAAYWIGKRRSVVFYHHCYYHHHYLAQALRNRGWDAISVSLENPSAPNYQYYHGDDVNLYDPDPEKFEQNLEQFYEMALERFQIMHFAGDGQLSFFPKNYALPNPPDILRWKAAGHKIAYTTSGCNSGVTQRSIRVWSALNNQLVPICENCVHEHNPAVCSDNKNIEWAMRVERFCDVIFADSAPSLDLLQSYKRIRAHVASAMNPEIWHPDLAIPDQFKVAREPGEILIYHAFGNIEMRSDSSRNPKGTPAVMAAIDRLKREGHRVRLLFVTNVANIDLRYIQAQADIVVDQLHFGRYGATAKECMMLGKPVICYINPHETADEFNFPSMKELPLVSATTETIYSVLEDLVLNPAKCKSIGDAGSRYMLKWHSADVCAERYEKVYSMMLRPGGLHQSYIDRVAY